MLCKWSLATLFLSTLNFAECAPSNTYSTAAGPADNPTRDLEQVDLDYGIPEDEFYNEWDETMKNFHPKSYLNAVISGRNKETFYELVEKPPVNIRGIFYTLDEGDEEEEEVRLIIISPNGDILYNKAASEGIFSIAANISGEYSFELSNSNWLTKVPTAFLIGTDDHGLLLSEHIENTATNLLKLKTSIDGIYNQYHYLWYRGQKQVAIAIKEQKKLLIYAAIQLILIFACSFFSIWNIKRMLSSTRAM